MSGIKELKNQIAAAEKEQNEKKVNILMGQLAALIENADKQIRDHQREIDFKTHEYTIEMLVDKYSEGLENDTNELFIPDYQREFKWGNDRQSKLIESLLIGLPIPYIFTADISNEDPEFDGRVEIVDGVQRISTIHAFVKDKLALENLNLLKDLNGFKFSDFPLSRQRRFQRIPIRVIELSEKCDEETRRDLFERINSGSLELEAQEKRHGSTLADTKFYKEVLQPCSELPLLHSLAPVSQVKKDSGEYIELLLRFFAYREKHSEYKGDVAPFLNNYLGTFKQKDNIDVGSYKKMLNEMLNFVESNFEYGFRKTSGSNSTPRARFESIAVGVSLALAEDPSLKTSKTKVSKWLYSDDFKIATTSDGANNVGNFFRRISFVKDMLLGK